MMSDSAQITVDGSAGELNASYDVVIIGASAAGCSTAILFAQQGLRVAMVEQRTTLDAYKKVCTHYLQPEVIPQLKKMGVWEQILEAGAVPSHMTARTKWGRVNLPHMGEARGINLRREKLDPILRTKAVCFPNVTLFSGYKLDALITEKERYSAAIICREADDKLRLDSKLIVGADGRTSQCARLSGAKESRVANQRFSYFSFYQHLPERYDGDTQVWIVDGGESYAAAFPNDQDLILISAYLTNKHYSDWQGNIEGQYENYIRSLPDGPKIDQAQRVTPIYGMKKGDSILRTAAVPGLALVGDAALAIDPLSGAGIALAIHSANLLSEQVSAALQSGEIEQIDKALGRYRRKHKFKFGMTYFILSRFSRAKTYHPATKLLLWLAVKLLGRKNKPSVHLPFDSL
jgi:2-polyprenyl-6-methoxyphenol hydroxylase-like FAD-dependent oxidoreductase